MASLTKIMTCILSLYLSRKFNLSLDSIVKISRRASSLIGTSAELEAGDKICLKDLLYGMMLPSGNDAAYAIA